jgi:hypothetical protein
MNAINIISPYRHNGTWVFDDARHGLVREPFVAGVDTLIDRAVADIPNAAEGFNLIFSSRAFPGHRRETHEPRPVETAAKDDQTPAHGESAAADPHAGTKRRHRRANRPYINGCDPRHLVRPL